MSAKLIISEDINFLTVLFNKQLKKWNNHCKISAKIWLNNNLDSKKSHTNNISENNPSKLLLQNFYEIRIQLHFAFVYQTTCTH